MQCQETKTDGDQCTRDAEDGRDYCWQHPNNDDPQPHEQYPSQQIIDVLKAYRGGVYLAAEELGCAPSTIYRRAHDDDDIRAVLVTEQGKVDDRAELGLIKAIQNGEPWAIRFRLKHKASRGYEESMNVNVGGQDGASLDPQVFDDLLDMDEDERRERIQDLDQMQSQLDPEDGNDDES